MQTLVLGTSLVSQVLAWASKNTIQALDIFEVVHQLAGVLVIIGAALVVATAEPRWRSRLWAMAVVLVAIFATSLSAPAIAVTGSSAAPVPEDVGFSFPIVVAAVVAAVLILGAVRLVFRVIGFIAQVIELLVVVRLAALVAAVVAVVLVAAATGL